MEAMTKRITLLILTALTFTSASVDAQKNNYVAESALDKVYAEMSKYDHMVLSFDYSLTNKEAKLTQNTSGTIYIQEPKYRLELFESIQLFDGINTYSILPENLEVVISAPSPKNNGDEINPSELFSFYKEGYRIDKGSEVGQERLEVVLYPIDSNAEIEKVIVLIDLKANRLISLKQIGFNDTETTITIKGYNTTTPIDQKLFAFDRKTFEAKGYYIID
ncbi:MAG: hypothetical protein RLZZ242_967 [Bacteroidota bacterium]|jgi:outer membrane lipoprotein-sorting protein